jgi:hypothetical protein
MRQVKPLFPVFHIPPRMHARATAKPIRVSKSVKAFTRLIHTQAFRIWPPINQKVIFEHFFSQFQSVAPIGMHTSSYHYYVNPAYVIIM